MYNLIGGISVLVMIAAVIRNNISYSLISDIVKNLAFGCVASTIVASLIEVGNVKEKNEHSNSVYDSVYIDLQCKIFWYLETWARLCCIAYKDKDYYKEKHTWMEWYEITKNKFAKCDVSKQAELLQFFEGQLMCSVDGIERSLKQIYSQQYILDIHGLYDENLKKILLDYSFVFDVVKFTVTRNHTNDDFWKRFDAIHQDLEKYISNWVDIRYYNYYSFSPYKLFNDNNILRAMSESETNQQ